MHLIHQISMDQKPERYSSSSSMANSTFSDQIPISFPSNNELGFMEMLGFQDHHDFTYPTSIWDFLINHPLPVPVPVPPPPLAVPSQSQPLPPPSLPSPAPSEVVNTPVTPNSSFSISSYSAEGTAATPNDDQQIRTESEKEQQQEDQQKSKKLLKPKKKNQKKRAKEPRFAFKTKTEVEHLDDGFRWRKYGQKAVKNSPFPRSYYRCTTPACGVKKRVERSFEDSSIVVTTYEGTHTHPCPITGRASLTFMPVAEPATTFGGGVLELINTPGETSTIPTTFSDAGGGGSSPPFLIPEMLHSHHHHQVQPQTQQSQQQTFYNPTETLNINDGTNTNANVNPMSSFANLVQERRFCPPSTRDDGLLQDILPSKMLLIKDPIPKQG